MTFARLFKAVSDNSDLLECENQLVFFRKIILSMSLFFPNLSRPFLFLFINSLPKYGLKRIYNMTLRVNEVVLFPGASEIRSQLGGMVSGFVYLEKSTGCHYDAVKIPHYYMVFVMEGIISVTNTVLGTREVGPQRIFMLSQGDSLQMEMLTDAKVMIMFFDAPLVKSEIRQLRHICNKASATKFQFMALEYDEKLKSLLSFILGCIHDRNMDESLYCAHVNSIIFMYILGNYPWNDLAGFFFPILNSKFDFRGFILGNYLEANRSVEKLISLSGLSESVFYHRFKSEFGITAKQWLMQKEAELLLEEAGRPDATPSILIEKLKLNNSNQLRLLCAKHFGCTASQLISRQHRKKINIVHIYKNSANKPARKQYL